MRAIECGGKLRMQAAVLLLAACLSGCGGGSVAAPPPPAVTVAVVGPTAVLNTGSSFTLTATVHNASNSAVIWSVVEVGGGSITAGGVYTAPATPGTYTVKATSESDPSASGTAPARVVIPVGHIAGYDVGVDYHAYGADIDTTGFISIYNQPQVRSTVQAQLQGMADRGATSIQTGIWFAKEPGMSDCCSTVQVTFPMTDQEQANLRAYAQDVAAVQGSGGNRPRLDIVLMWLGAADYTIGSPTTTLGYSHLSPTEFISRVQTATDQLLAAVSDVTRPDGVRLVDTISFDWVLIPAPGESNGNPNDGWFVTNNYPRFVSATSQVGLRPTVFFQADGNQAAVLDDTWIDPVYPNP